MWNLMAQSANIAKHESGGEQTFYVAWHYDDYDCNNVLLVIWYFFV